MDVSCVVWGIVAGYLANVLCVYGLHITPKWTAAIPGLSFLVAVACVSMIVVLLVMLWFYCTLIGSYMFVDCCKQLYNEVTRGSVVS